MKNKIKKILLKITKIITPDIMKTIILVGLLLVFIGSVSKGKNLVDLLDYGFLFSVILLVVSNILVNILNRCLGAITEDYSKLTEEYDEIVKKYSLDMNKMVYINNHSKDVKNFIDNNKEKKYVPCVLICERKINSNAFNFEINPNLISGKINTFELPKQIKDNSSELFKAHKYSVVYNQKNIRTKSIEYDNEKNSVKILYEFTTYYDSLITNRAMDYKYNAQRTVREVFEPGPYISSLEDSKLSNHLGFNGFVELSDHTIVFVHRGKKLSIAKNLLATSVGASLKTKYALDEKRKFTKEYLANAIREEIKDELKLEIDEKFDFSSSIFAFYRDLIEGGKPQFLFYYKTNKYDRESFYKNFKDHMDKKAIKNNKKKQIVDGTKFEFFTIDQIKNAKFTNSSITIDNVEYKMTPSSVASCILLINNL